MVFRAIYPQPHGFLTVVGHPFIGVFEAFYHGGDVAQPQLHTLSILHHRQVEVFLGPVTALIQCDQNIAARRTHGACALFHRVATHQLGNIGQRQTVALQLLLRQLDVNLFVGQATHHHLRNFRCLQQRGLDALTKALH